MSLDEERIRELQRKDQEHDARLDMQKEKDDEHDIRIDALYSKEREQEFKLKILCYLLCRHISLH